MRDENIRTKICTYINYLRVALNGIIGLDAREMTAPIVVLVDDNTEVHNKERVLGRKVRIIDVNITKARIAGVVSIANVIGAGNTLEVVASRAAEALANGTSSEIHLILLEDIAQDAGVFLGIEL